MGKFAKRSEYVEVPSLEAIGLEVCTNGNDRPWINNPPIPITRNNEVIGQSLGNLTLKQVVEYDGEKVEVSILRVGIAEWNDGTRTVMSIASHRNRAGERVTDSEFTPGTGDLIIAKWNEIALQRMASATKSDPPGVGGEPIT